MSDEKNVCSLRKQRIEKITSSADPFAALNELLAQDSELKAAYDNVVACLDDGTTDYNEAEFVEIDGRDYLVCGELSLAGSRYVYLVNTADVMDSMIQKIVTENGEEYLIGLESKKEFDFIFAHFQRDVLLRLKEKLERESDTPAQQ